MEQPPDDAHETAGCAGGSLRRDAVDTMPRRSPALRRRLVWPALASAGLLAVGAEAAHAQVQVGGQPDAVRIEATDATLREVLDALRANFNLRYRSNEVLDTRLTGSFGGSLQRVAARVLDGYDFVIKIAPQGVDVLVVRQSQPDSKAVAASMPARAPSKMSPAPVMTAAEANRYERGQSR
jgi:uncharacterized protein (DUF2342 family)